MTGAFIKMEPGALRDLHWHPNANEWQYIINGTLDFGVFNGTNQISEGSGGPGDIGYAPKGSGHYFINTGMSILRMPTFSASFRGASLGLAACYELVANEQKAL